MAPIILNNRYRIIQTLGSGGFGDTFLAEDTQMPSKRRCVIKQLKPVANNSQVYQLIQERFAREAAVLEYLGERNSQIPKLYAYFSEGGVFYLIQEWIEGDPLSQKVKTQGILSERQVRDILISLLSVLDYIHNRGIIHRDIKPDNIILRHRDGLPILIDFGAVKEIMSTVVTASGNTTNSIVIGTPGFMPPEQAVGKPVYASDLYSLGLTAIYLLTGKLPQELETDPRSGEFIWRHHAPRLSLNLAEILDKAIKSHHRERFLTAREMLNALQTSTILIKPTIWQTIFPPTASPPVSPLPPTTPPPTASPPVSPLPPTTPPPTASLPVSLLPPTIPLPPMSPLPPTVPNQPIEIPPTPPSSLEDWQKAAIVSGVIGISIIFGFVITKFLPTPSPSSQPLTSQPSTSQPSTSQPLTSQPLTFQPVTPSKPQESPTDTVRNYYSNIINNRQYEIGWNMLSRNFQKKYSEDSYDAYIGWWEKVKRVELQQLKLVESGTESAVVDVELTYLMKEGIVIPDSKRLLLVLDAEKNSWLIDDQYR